MEVIYLIVLAVGVIGAYVIGWWAAGGHKDDSASVHKEFVSILNGMQNRQTELAMWLIETEEDMLNNSEGCRCPNNVGGDCEYCQAMQKIKDRREYVISRAKTTTAS